MKSFFFGTIFLLVSNFLMAQSINFIHPKPLWNDAMPKMEMDAVPLAKLQAEDELNKNNKTIPWRFGYEFETNINPDNAGTWQVLPDGSRLWQIKISSPNAQSLNFMFTNFHLPNDAYIIIYNNKNETQIGTYNASHNNVENIVGTTLIAGDEAVIEYVEPANAAFKGTFNISKIIHGYRIYDYKSTFSLGFGSSGSCENNVNCPIGAAWQKEKHAVVVILCGGGYCSGSLLNDVNQDTIPFLMTAHHCGSSGFASWVFYFNYESPNCNKINGPLNETVNGATMMATNTKSDFTLLKLFSKVPLSYHPFFAGWNTSNTPPDSVVGIHHPEGDIKKISFANNQCYDSSYTDSYTALCWNIKHWDSGVTEPGSSGSPLYNKHHQFVGQLFGGPSACGYPDSLLNDYYGKFSTSWNADTAIHTQVKFWLDPQNTGATSIAGFDPNPAKSLGVENVIENDVQIYPNPTSSLISIQLSVGSLKTVEVIDLQGRKINLPISFQNADYCILKTENLSSGIYFLKIVDEKNNAVVKKFVKE